MKIEFFDGISHISDLPAYHPGRAKAGKIELLDIVSPPPAEFKTNAELMRFVAEVMNRCLYLLRVGVTAAPDTETANTGYAKPKAIIVGYMVQLTKLYEGALIQICGAQPELTRLFFAPIFEVVKNMESLIISSRAIRP